MQNALQLSDIHLTGYASTGLLLPVSVRCHGRVPLFSIVDDSMMKKPGNFHSGSGVGLEPRAVTELQSRRVRVQNGVHV